MNLILAEMISAAKDGALVLTANKRLARHLVSNFDDQQQQLGETAWDSPNIFSLEVWLQRAMAELGEQWRFLNGVQSLWLWENLIEKHAAGDTFELLQLGATARRAQQAYQLLESYGCHGHEFPLTEDQRVFAGWFEEYQRECEDRGWVDRAALSGLIFQAINAKRLTLPDQILVYGFDQLPPEILRLRVVQQRQGGTFYVVQMAGVSEAEILACQDQSQEVELAARWARGLLDRGESSIGVVVLDLKERRNLVERVFRDQIEPESALQAHDRDPAFTLSLGAPLAEQGIVNAALEFLSISARLTMEQVSFLLRSPYLAGGLCEADERAVLDGRLRGFRQKDIYLKQLIDVVADGGATPGLKQPLDALLHFAAGSKKRLPSEWALVFDALLHRVGWPGEQGLSSREYQVVKAWREKALPGLACLDLVSMEITRPRALGLLRRVAQDNEFQVEAPTGPVQVLGLLESAGLVFDHLWVMGAGETTLPAKAQPNPFLPTGLQIERGMPHSGPARELAFARNVVTRLKCAAPRVIFSYAAMVGDCDFRPSPLLADLPSPAAPSFADKNDAYSCLMARAPTMDIVQDTQGPALSGDRGAGGTTLLKDQALCPFRAFAHSRLGIKGFEAAKPGLDPRVRGDLLHRTLEYLWRELKSQAALLALTEHERDNMVSAQAARAVSDYFQKRVSPPEKILGLERRRLQALVVEWLEKVEAVRPAFVVEDLEKEHNVQIGQLVIKTLIDRVDRLEENQRVILDYKTGKMSVDALVDERLLEPQLPIYTTTGEVEAVAFAQVRRGESKLLGVAKDEELLPKVGSVGKNKKAGDLGISDWQALMAYWRTQLEGLANDFVAGVAAVDPVDPIKACQYCDLKTFCRVAESIFVAGQGGET